MNYQAFLHPASWLLESLEFFFDEKAACAMHAAFLDTNECLFCCGNRRGGGRRCYNGGGSRRCMARRSGFTLHIDLVSALHHDEDRYARKYNKPRKEFQHVASPIVVYKKTPDDAGVCPESRLQGKTYVLLARCHVEDPT
jgi:hypothetical protein